MKKSPVFERARSQVAADASRSVRLVTRGRFSPNHPAPYLCVCLATFYAGTASAQSPVQGSAELPPVIVTGNPLGSGLFELVTPVDSLSGQALNARRASTLGETLANEPGVSSTLFGPNASRPIIRGLDGDRIRLMQNGVGSVDASSLSFDHATTIEPLVADRLEIVRGPAALLYGGNAIGGVVNAIDNRIPTRPIDGATGRGELRAGSADSERAGVAVLEGGNGSFAVHADGYRRNTEDVRIPGFARSARQRALDDPSVEQPDGRLPNTYSRSEGGSLGASMTWDKGYVGLSVGSLRSEYGTPAEDTVKIDMRKDTFDLAGESRGLSGFVRGVKYRLSQTDYEHQEKQKDTGEVNTTFKSRGYEGRVEVTHAPIGPLNGAIGLQFGSLDFSALGAEAFVPSTRTNTSALFIYEEFARSNWKISFGGRLDNVSIDSSGDTAESGGRFGGADRRTFNARSASVGGVYNLAPSFALVGNIAVTQRAPTNYELFANGPHAATGSYEVGNRDFDLERSTAFDLALRHKSGANAFSVGVYRTQFQNYIALVPTGRSRAETGALEDPATPGVTLDGDAADLPEYQFQQIRALFQGMEAQGRWRLGQFGGPLDLEAKADYVRATNRDTGEPIPRIPPMRFSAALVWQAGSFYTRGEVLHARAHTRTAENELPTDSYTLVNVYLSHRIRSNSRTTWELFLRGTNLLNAEARYSTSVLKDIAPVAGRGLLVGVRAFF